LVLLAVQVPPPSTLRSWGKLADCVFVCVFSPMIISGLIVYFPLNVLEFIRFIRLTASSYVQLRRDGVCRARALASMFTSKAATQPAAAHTACCPLWTVPVLFAWWYILLVLYVLSLRSLPSHVAPKEGKQP
jgi:hypothetical protein